MSRRRTTRAALPAQALGVKDPAVRQALEAIAERLQVWEGAGRGHPLDRVLTLRDLAVETDALATLRSALGGSVGNSPIFDDGTGGSESRRRPPAPTNLETHGIFTRVILRWEFPSSYRTLSHFEIWRAGVDDRSQAVLVGSSGMLRMYADPVDNLETHYYWVRAVSSGHPPLYGDFNAIEGTEGATRADPQFLLEQLEGEILSSHLHESLSSPIGEIPGLKQTLTQAQEDIDAAQGAVAQTRQDLENLVGQARQDLEGAISGAQQDVFEALAAIGVIEATLSDLQGTPTFDPDMTYPAGALVIHEGALYRALQEITATPAPVPGDAPLYWEKVGEYASLGEAVSAIAAAVDDVTLRVDEVDGTLVAQGQSLTSLQTAVFDEDEGLASKASSHDLTTMKSTIFGSSVTEFSQIKAEFESQQEDIDSRATVDRLETVESGIYGASAEAFTGLSAKFSDLQEDIDSRATVQALEKAESDIYKAEASMFTGLAAAFAGLGDEIENSTSNILQLAKAYADDESSTAQMAKALSSEFGDAAARQVHRWEFSGTTRHGWRATSGSTFEMQDGAGVFVAGDNNPYLHRALTPEEYFHGGDFPIIRARVRRVHDAGGPWEGRVYYQTADHGYGGAFYAQIPPPADLDEWNTLVFDMRDLVAGGDDWVESEIRAFRLDFVDHGPGGDVWEVEWIAVSAEAPVQAQLRTLERTITDETGALSQRITALDARLDDPDTGLASLATIDYVDTAESNIYGASAETFTGLKAVFDSLQEDIDSRATVDRLDTVESDIYKAEASAFTGLTAMFNALQNDIDSRATIDRLDTVESDIYKAEASAFTGLTSKFNEISEDISAAEASALSLAKTYTDEESSVATSLQQLTAEFRDLDRGRGNLLRNASFELGLAPHRPISGAQRGVWSVVETADAFHGEHVLQLESTEGLTSYGRINLGGNHSDPTAHIPARPGDTYRLSVMARLAEGDADWVRVRIRFFGSERTQIEASPTSNRIAPTPEWQACSATYEVPEEVPEGAYVVPHLEVLFTGKACKVWLDDVRWERIDSEAYKEIATRATMDQVNNAIATKTGAMASRLDTLETEFHDPATGIASKVSSTEFTEAISDESEARGSEINRLEGQIGDTTAAIQEERSIRLLASAEDYDPDETWPKDSLVAYQEGVFRAKTQVPRGLGAAPPNTTYWEPYSRNMAQWTLKVDVDGKVSGIGMENTGPDNASQIEIYADKFAIVSTDQDGNSVMPFATQGKDVYLNTAIIGDASITSAMIGHVAAEKIVAEDLSAISSDLGDITAGSINIFDNFTVDNQGNVVMKSAQIRNAQGQVILSSGTGVEWRHIGGAGKPDSYAGRDGNMIWDPTFEKYFAGHRGYWADGPATTRVAANQGEAPGTPALEISPYDPNVGPYNGTHVLIDALPRIEFMPGETLWVEIRVRRSNAFSAGARVAVSWFDANGVQGGVYTTGNLLEQIPNDNVWRTAVGRIMIPANSPAAFLARPEIAAGGSTDGVLRICHIYMGRTPRRVSAGNISTFIEDLSVNTLQIGHNAVTVPVQGSVAGEMTINQLSSANGTPPDWPSPPPPGRRIRRPAQGDSSFAILKETFWGTPQTIVSIAVDSRGQPVHFVATFGYRPYTGNTGFLLLRILRLSDGKVIWGTQPPLYCEAVDVITGALDGAGVNNNDKTRRYTVAALDPSPLWGTQTYALQGWRLGSSRWEREGGFLEGGQPPPGLRVFDRLMVATGLRR